MKGSKGPAHSNISTTREVQSGHQTGISAGSRSSKGLASANASILHSPNRSNGSTSRPNRNNILVNGWQGSTQRIICSLGKAKGSKGSRRIRKGQHMHLLQRERFERTRKLTHHCSTQRETFVMTQNSTYPCYPRREWFVSIYTPHYRHSSMSVTANT